MAVLFAAGADPESATGTLHTPPSAGPSGTAALPAAPPTATLDLPTFDLPCHTDDECGYDPSRGRCGADPRFNKQPPLVDQGLVCYCDAAMSACALLRVEPAPCEGEESCAIRMDPRPHPVRASAELRYQKPGACRAPKPGQQRRTDRFTTCERTNICTMHTRECATP